MEKITKTYTATEQTIVNKSKEVYVTTDGREFDIRDKEKAERHQLRLDKIAAFKEKINYKKVDLTLCDHYDYSHETSFVFDIKQPEWDNEPNMICSMTDIYPSHRNEPLKEGRYLVIEYSSDLGNGPSSSGYFGLLSDYIKELEKHLEIAKSAF